VDEIGDDEYNKQRADIEAEEKVLGK